MGWRAVVVVAAVGWMASGRAAESAPARFFVAGDGTLALASTHGGGSVQVRYRDAKGHYDAAALARLRHVMRSADGAEGPLPLRLVEALAWLQHETGRRPLTVISGYRSPAHNEDIRSKGARAAAASLHTEGLAADLAFPKRDLPALWHRIRDRECCGAGMYKDQGFLHFDVGRPRFWEPATSRVEENISAGNARVFARTDFDRYPAAEAIAVTFYALTVPPIGIVARARFSPDAGEAVELPLESAQGDCVQVESTGTTLRLHGAPQARGRGRIILATCDPRPERTPETIETNPIELR